MKTPFFVSIAVLSVLITQSCQKQSQDGSIPAEYIMNFVPAKTNSELLALVKNPEANVIRDVKQLDVILENKLSPLSKLSKKDISFFKQYLVKGAQGFGSMHVGVLKANLSAEDYNKVMAMFGLDTQNGFWDNANSSTSSQRLRTTDDGTGRDYTYRQCDGSHNCIRVIQDIICTSNC